MQNIFSHLFNEISKGNNVVSCISIKYKQFAQSYAVLFFHSMAQAVGAVEYNGCISAEIYDSPNEYPEYE